MTDWTDWKQPIRDLVARITDPAARAELAHLMERGVEIALQLSAGVPGASRDLGIVSASIVHLASAEIQETVQAMEAAARARLRQILWGTLFGLAVP